jgi:uracil-DNA glycosylase
MDKKLLLKKLKEETIKLDSNIVFGEGSINSRILFIGEAPGAKEEELGRPFVGRSGKLLDKSLEEIGLSREDVYITNIVKKRPPDNRDPNNKEINTYSPYLKREIEIINPKIIVTLGRFSLNYFIPEVKISESQGNLLKLNNLSIFPIFHPAAAMRSSRRMVEFKNSFKELKKHID